MFVFCICYIYHKDINFDHYFGKIGQAVACKLMGTQTVAMEVTVLRLDKTLMDKTLPIVVTEREG